MIHDRYAEALGYQACKNGEPLDKSPYKKNSDGYSAWRTGWLRKYRQRDRAPKPPKHDGQERLL
jgi:ribosome modulation factor